MKNIAVDSRSFEFDDDWLVMKYDSTPYYNHQFKGKRKNAKGLKKEMKAVDLIAMNPDDGSLYLIESKDYRSHIRQKTETPADEFVHKVLDTLTGILPTALCSMRDVNGRHANAQEEILHRQLHEAQKMRLVFQFEQPQKHSKLFPRAYDPADMQSIIRRELGMIDSHALVIDANTQYKVQWTVH